jgi:alpha-L-rhamnosidase
MRANLLWCGAVASVIAGCWLLSAATAPSSVADLRRAFEQPPADARIMVRWWWFGPAVVPGELERELRTMKEGGIGGVEVQPVYPLELDNPATGIKSMPYLSDGFLDALRFTAGKTKELGLRFDLTLCSGWPYGGPHIPITQAAGRLRIERVPVAAGATSVPRPELPAGDTFVAAFVDNQRIADVSPSALTFPPDAGHARTALIFISSHTRMMVKRAAVGAEGFVLDHYDHAAIENHLHTVGDRLATAFDGNTPYAVFSDSLEDERSDWTLNFPAEFQKRRGYDVVPLLPALATGAGADAAAIRHDWGRTLTELADENYLTPIRDWAHQHGTLFRSQTYGTPPVSLSSNALADLPEGEGSSWRTFSATRWAASASHLYNRTVTSSETWTWVHSPVFRATPLDLKAEADLHFIQGINQLVGHGWPYSPESAGEPGWRFYAAGVLNNHNPWWIVMPDISLYLQRISFLLRQGHPANDVAVYLPTDDAYAAFTPGNVSINKSMDQLIGPAVIPQILDAGYNFDYIDDAAIAHSGVTYPVLILPRVQRIPLATYKKLEEYVRKGGILVAVQKTPSLAPGLKDQSDTAQIGEISRSLFRNADSRGHLVEDESHLGQSLQQWLKPDLAASSEIGFIHRKLDFADVYFLANTSNHPVHTAAVFRSNLPQAAWWDPFSAKVTKAAGARLDLDLAPYESRVVVFSKEAAPPAAATPGAPAPAPIEVTGSWNDAAAWVNFSGQKTYDTTITVPPSMLASHRALYLNFGEGAPVTTQERRAGNGMRAMLESPVREAAVIYVNGKRAGSVWHPPYEVEVGALLHVGANTIRITVANLAINELAKGPLPDYKALNAKYGERFQAQDMTGLQSLPSGILAPVRLIAK